NLRTFQDKARSLDVICNLIKESVKLKVLGLTINDTYQVAEATKIWDLHVKRRMGKKKDMGSFQVVGWLMEDFCYQEMLFYELSDD
ncbi:hypothetical protein Tco_1128910, partial [Tanacetum coccineum]